MSADRDPGPGAPFAGGRRTAHRSLPGPIIDLIRDGVPHAGKDQRRTYNAAVRTAMSAQQRGWPYYEWESLMMEPASRLGIQIALRRRDVRQCLRQAWARAAQRIAMSPPMTSDQARDFVDDLELELASRPEPDSAERIVMQFALDRGRELGTKRVALPWRQVVDETGLTQAVVKRVLSTRASGFLQLAERGRAGLHGRATLYWLRPPTSPVPGRCVGGPGGGTTPGPPGGGTP